jgi:hypothetical protein
MTNTLSFNENPGKSIASSHLLNIFSSTDAFTIFHFHLILLIIYDPTNKTTPYLLSQLLKMNCVWPPGNLPYNQCSLYFNI